MTFGLLRPIIARAQVHSDRIDIDLATGQMANALLGGGGHDLEDDRQDDANGDSEYLWLTIAAELQLAGKEMRFLVAGATNAIPTDASLVRLLTRAQALADRLTADPSLTLEEAGVAENMGTPYADCATRAT